MEGWIIMALLLLVLLNWGISSAFEQIAEMKGHPERKYFWWCFCTGPAGYLMVAALPDWGEAGTNTDTVRDELPPL